MKNRRIRGKTILVEYRTNKIEQIKSKILKSVDCKYAIKKEESEDGKVRVLVLLEFSNSMDINTSFFRIDIDGELLDNTCRTVLDKKLARDYLLKSNTKDSLSTNFEKEVLSSHSFILKSVGKEDGLPSKISHKKPMSIKQSKKIDEYLVIVETGLTSELPDVTRLRKKLMNVTNYFYQPVEISESFKNRYNQCKDKLKELAKQV